MRESESSNATPVTNVVSDVLAELRRIERMHGEQDMPSLDPRLLGRAGGCTNERMAEEYEIPGELRAKFLCHAAKTGKRITWMHVLVEEVAEVAGCMDDEEAMYEEVVQVASVAVAWAENIRRRLGK